MFTLITLPYGLEGLESVISARTLKFHQWNKEVDN